MLNKHDLNILAELQKGVVHKFIPDRTIRGENPLHKKDKRVPGVISGLASFWCSVFSEKNQKPSQHF